MYWLIVLILLIPFQLFAKNLYVSPTGSDDVSYASNSMQKPWLTPLKGWTEALAGDTVYFLKGTYYINNQVNTRLYGKDGTSNSPIVFTAYKDDIVTFETKISGNSGTNAIPFLIEKDYNIVQNINFVGGSTWFMVGWDTSVDHFLIKNCNAELKMGGDNTGFVYASSHSKYVSVNKCDVKGAGLRSAGIHQNTACIIAFNCVGFQVSECKLGNAPCGIYYKHGQALPDSSEVVLEKNFIYDTDRFSIFLNTSKAIVRNNIMGPNNADLVINEANGGPRGDYNLIYNNLFSSNGLGISHEDNGARYNKIFKNVFRKKLYIYAYSSEPHYTQLDSNIYYSDTACVNNRVYYNLAKWQSYSSQDKNSINYKFNFFDNSKSPYDTAYYAIPNYNNDPKSADTGWAERIIKFNSQPQKTAAVKELSPGISKVNTQIQKDNIQVEFNRLSDFGNAVISVYNIAGKCMSSKNLCLSGNSQTQTATIPLGSRSLASGAYYVQLDLMDSKQNRKNFKLPFFVMK